METKDPDFSKITNIYTVTMASIVEFVPDSREKSLAITKLEESLMWAVNAIQKHGVNDGNQEA